MITNCLALIRVASCKKRWKNIRDNYYKQKKNTQMPTGSASKNRKRNPILEQLGFLDVVEHKRSVLTNMQVDNIQSVAREANTEINAEESDESIQEEIPLEVPTCSAS
nr:uncharacterized protein LOC111415162 [Onthophagus taurus]